MTNYVFTSGPMEGMVVEENTKILEEDFQDLDEDMQIRIRQFGELLFPNLEDDEDFPISSNDLRDRYEDSWQSEEIQKIFAIVEHDDEEDADICIGLSFEPENGWKNGDRLATKEEMGLADQCVGSIFEALSEGELVELLEGVCRLDEELYPVSI